MAIKNKPLKWFKNNCVSIIAHGLNRGL